MGERSKEAFDRLKHASDVVGVYTRIGFLVVAIRLISQSQPGKNILDDPLAHIDAAHVITLLALLFLSSLVLWLAWYLIDYFMTLVTERFGALSWLEFVLHYLAIGIILILLLVLVAF
ncbi:hypothetical protein [Ferirhizobium litorale]|uniref:Uncharacterized protein n=1 Tax=Ferirhizobium litorale TaxID=2927786 RepID=A0AAE3QHQ4_9HYPH|nr:hypothetical protein [Fererhizobium litorale]MDI7923389.1 hypothetical protein [Fererhizobium litorale]